MRNNLILLVIVFLTGATLSCSKPKTTESLQKKLSEYVKDKDASIGVAVIVDRKDTTMVNGNKAFPMLSVYKFPIAVALGDWLRSRGVRTPDSVSVYRSDLRPDTYSPMREKYAGAVSVRLPLNEVLAYALQQSDNNASDILLKMMGGTDNATESLNRLGIGDINIVSTEAEMHHDNALSYQNSATPVAMAKMMDRFDHDFDDSYSIQIKQLMETCKTGGNRLAKPLDGTNAIIGHKTGTGFILPDGRLMAVNDAGYVHLPDGRHYSIAVFIENSGYDMERTEAIIADISSIVYDHLTERER